MNNPDFCTMYNARICAGAKVLTCRPDSVIAYREAGSLVDVLSTVWTGYRWAADVCFTRTMVHAPIVRVTMSNGRYIRCEPMHEFLAFPDDPDEPQRVAAGHLKPSQRLFVRAPGRMLARHQPDVFVLGVAPDGTEDVFCCDVKHPEHSFMLEGVIVSNCTNDEAERFPDAATSVVTI